MAAWTRMLDVGGSILETWAMVAVVWGALLMLARRFKIQRCGFDAGLLRHELLYSALTLGASAMTIGILWGALRRGGWMTFGDGDPTAWTIAGEFAVYFFAFDFYFYAIHRAMHLRPVFHLVHSTHHRSTAPDPLTAFSFNPIEGILTGGFLPLFLSAFEVHRASLALIAGFQPLMSLFVHCGHEFFPRWWYRFPGTGWLLTPLFHDQHHSLVGCNYGGFTTLWDRVFGTVNPSYASDFESLDWRTPKPAAQYLNPTRNP
jgi:sterol desaturase/sphingolipid hydroxylase (fatty acid hydroxylase superfamily)